MPFPIAATTAANASNGATRSRNAAPHRKNAALRSRSDSPYQQRTTQRDNPTQLLIKQAVDYLIQQIEAGKSETLTAYLNAMARFHAYSFGNNLQIASGLRSKLVQLPSAASISANLRTPIACVSASIGYCSFPALTTKRRSGLRSWQAI